MYTKNGQEAANNHNTLDRRKASEAFDSPKVLNPPHINDPYIVSAQKLKQNL